MRTSASRLLTALGACVAFGGALVPAQAPTPSAAAAPHVAAAKAAAGQDQTFLFNQLCTPPPASAPAPQAASAPAAAPAPPPRAGWHAEPARVFDNLYFLGMTEYTAWAVTTSDGIIVIDPKLPALMKRVAGAPHPYVVGNASIGRFLTVADECAKAGPLW